MAKTKWAIMVCLDEKEDDWIYVTETSNDCWDLKPLLFDDIVEAFNYSKSFTIPGKEQNVTIVNYTYES
jgi:hypothetical protein